ncbi:MAG: hypothetical protein PHQ34_13075 [Methanothrix sp.]|nr:hypothetical protein [Methanothrix sp.]
MVAVAFSGCAEKQATENSVQQNESNLKQADQNADLGLKATNASLFLQDFNQVNDPYKKTLFATGQGQRNESIKYYENLTESLMAFEEKYKDYRPQEIKSDTQFSGDMSNVSAIISGVKEEIYTGNLTEAHKVLEGVRPIFQGMLTRNNLLPLSVALVDFHDAMEIVLDAANKKDAAGVMEAYPKADERLKAVESINDESGIKAIRVNLDAVMNLAKENKTGELPAKAGDLKASYVIVYLASS